MNSLIIATLAVALTGHLQGGLTKARDCFADGLGQQILSKQDSGNACLSPISMQLCLSMLLNGVAGTSVGPLRKTLRLGAESLDEVNIGNRKLMASLAGPNVTISDSVWLRSRSEPSSAFLSRIREDYAADCFAVPDLDAARPRINDWTREHTKGRIPTLFDKPFKDAVAVLVNTVTFDGKWQTQFDPKRTRTAPFHTASGETIEVPTMYLETEFRHAQSGGASAVELPYAGGDYAMVCILPPPVENVYAFAASLGASGIHDLVAHMEGGRYSVALPRFTFFSSYNMEPPLGRMGLEALYRGANLSGISPKIGRVEISEIVQKTWIKVDEEGTQAAAASGIVMAKSIPRGFIANRPFVFAILHVGTGAVLFYGVVEHPGG